MKLWLKRRKNLGFYESLLVELLLEDVLVELLLEDECYYKNYL